MPVISSTVSPFMRRATRKAPTWAGVASPDMMSRMTAAASSSERERTWETMRSMASRMVMGALPSLVRAAVRSCEDVSLAPPQIPA